MKILLLCLLAAVFALSDPATDRTSPIIIGHRGNPKFFPENSMASFRGAAQAGADGFETDLWLTKDGVIVLMHDPTLDRTSNCSGRISDKTYDQIKYCDVGKKFSSKFAGELIPRFDDAVKYAKSANLFIILDLKQEGLGRYIAPIVLGLGMQGRVIASCRSDAECRDDIQAFLPNVTMKQYLGSPPKPKDESFWAAYLKMGLNGFSLDFTSALTPAFVLAAHQHLMDVWVWTVDSQSGWLRAMQDGIDGIITNDPKGLVDYSATIRRKMFGPNEVAPTLGASDPHRTNPLLIGHRGFPAQYPENTMVSFRAAMANGADGFETDLWLTKDGVIVLSHDPNLDRMTNCTGTITQLTYDYIKTCDAGAKFNPKFAGEPVPTFEDAVILAKQTNGFIVMDLKQEGIAQQIAVILRKHGMETRMFASCRSDSSVANIAAYLPNTPRQRLAMAPQTLTEGYFNQAMQIGLHSFSFNYNADLNVPFVKAAHEHLLSVFSWTVNPPYLIQKAVREGHDGILTDDIVTLVQEVAALRKKVWP